MTIRYECPVFDCDWVVEAPQRRARHVDVPDLSSAFEESVRQMGRVERAVSDHLETHEVVDFLHTIMELRQQRERALSELSRHGYGRDAIEAVLVGRVPLIEPEPPPCGVLLWEGQRCMEPGLYARGLCRRHITALQETTG